MIKNERQYKITRAQAVRFSNILESLRQRPDADNSLHPLIAKAQEDAISSQLVLQRRFLNLVRHWPEITPRKARQPSCQACGQVAMKKSSRSYSCEPSL